MDGGKGKEKAGESIADESREALKKTVVELVQEALAEQLGKARPPSDMPGADKDTTGTKHFSQGAGMTG